MLPTDQLAHYCLTMSVWKQLQLPLKCNGCDFGWCLDHRWICRPLWENSYKGSGSLDHILATTWIIQTFKLIIALITMFSLPLISCYFLCRLNLIFWVTSFAPDIKYASLSDGSNVTELRSRFVKESGIFCARVYVNMTGNMPTYASTMPTCLGTCQNMLL